VDSDGGERREARQQRLQQRFFDLANAFVKVRMRFLRSTGIQPPDERDPRAKKKR
jgi:hypothetical protein